MQVTASVGTQRVSPRKKGEKKEIWVAFLMKELRRKSYAKTHSRRVNWRFPLFRVFFVLMSKGNKQSGTERSKKGWSCYFHNV